MNTSPTEGALRFPFAEVPEPGEIHEVAPGVGWLRMPLPGRLNHINLWILRGCDGATLVDTGMHLDQTKAIWESVLTGPLNGVPVRRVLCTHHHPDHMGLAAWLVRRTGAPLHVTAPELDAMRMWETIDTPTVEKFAVERYVRAGFGAELGHAFVEQRERYKDGVDKTPETAEFLDPSQPIEAADTTWQMIVGRGHSPELIALYAPELEVLISSDQVLPGISPNVSVPPQTPEANPLAQYLDTLRPFRKLPAETLVLPSHRKPFYGLHTRVDDLTLHHLERLSTVRATCEGHGATAAEVQDKMFVRRLDPTQVFMALGETLAHLNFLVATGDIAWDRTGPVDRYRTL